MAITFSNLHTEQGLKTVEEHLSGKTYISGDKLSVDDVKVYAAVLEKPGDGFPNVSKWYDTVASHLAKSFPGKAVGVKIGGGVAQSGTPKTETEDEKKAAEEREAAKKHTKKPKESGKSSVLLDVKPWDDETDMKKLEEAVRSVQMPGLYWGASKLVPVGYGIKKLTIMMTIDDDLVSVDNLIEDHLTSEPNNEYIQSVDIVAFNKI
ncbi:Elongation factor 1-beta 1 [Raphanus sativus]|nr:Elongation factor 1-beta 1 [Raphanus sativus]